MDKINQWALISLFLHYLEFDLLLESLSLPWILKFLCIFELCSVLLDYCIFASSILLCLPLTGLLPVLDLHYWIVSVLHHLL